MSCRSPRFAGVVACSLAVLVHSACQAPAAEHAVADGTSAPRVAAASDEAELAIKGFRVPKGWKVDLIAAEPDLANPVAFTFDEKERIHVVETFRLGEGVLDIRGRGRWPSQGFKDGLSPERRAQLTEETLDADLACRTVEDRERMLRVYFAENAPSLERASDRVKLIFRGPDGRATGSRVFADGFNALVDGLASGVLARGGDVWFANIPHLWRLRDFDGDGTAEQRDALLSGFGVRVGFLGHDLHGLAWGPDGRLYFTIGDRGASVTTLEGIRLETPDTGAVFRCEPDGRDLEIFATGLRNPQELVFDALGNLWTGDNNSDGGDQARWVYLVEGGDSGWRIGWQFLESPNPRGPWNSEGMWRPEEAAKIGYLVPPLANIGAGPSGITYAYGTGLPDDFAGRFFMVDFRGGPCGIWSIAVEPQGAGYRVSDAHELIWNALPTDVEVGPDGGLYWSDWVQGWNKPGKGRIFRAYDPVNVARPEALETRRLLATDFGAVGVDLGALLGHADLRIRRKAQQALVDAGAASVLSRVARVNDSRLHPAASLHGLWGLGQLARRQASLARSVVPNLRDSRPEVRGQAAKVLGDLRWQAAAPELRRLLIDREPRPRFFAAIALGRIGDSESAAALIEMLRENDDRDPYLRHAGVMGLTGAMNAGQLAALAGEPSRAVRLAAVVALRRHASPLVHRFLNDADPGVVLEAARAIHDLPIPEAMPKLAECLGRDAMPEALLRRVLNAQLRVGSAAGARALADFASDSRSPEARRAEAVRYLGRFGSPSGRDEVTGLWRPLPPRDGAPAREALRARFAGFMTAPDAVRAAAAVAAADLEVKEVTPELKRLALDGESGRAARLAALRTVAGWQDPGLEDLLATLSNDPQGSIRSEALRWQTRLGRGDRLSVIRRALERGELEEKQTALAGLGDIPGEAADALMTNWLARATARQVAPEVELELWEAARKRVAEPVRLALAAYENSLKDAQGNVVPRYFLKGGDRMAGWKVFFENEAVQCARCHKVGDQGAGVVGPDLAGVGLRLSREQLLDSILHPNAAVAQGFENVTIETRDGLEASGTVQRETDNELVLNTLESGTLTVKKGDLTYRRTGLSSMPEGLAEILAPRELRDVVEYLATLTGPAKQPDNASVREQAQTQ